MLLQCLMAYYFEDGNIENIDHDNIFISMFNGTMSSAYNFQLHYAHSKMIEWICGVFMAEIQISDLIKARHHWNFRFEK